MGKTTLSVEVASSSHPMRVLTLDDGPTRAVALDDPAGFIAGLDGPVLIDEIQRAPELLLEIKRAVDRDPSPGRFLLTGSANVFSSSRAVDALTGRVDRIRMWPLAQTEIRGGSLNLVDELLAGRAPQVADATVGHGAFSEIVASGGYPEARRRAGRSRERWFEDYIATAIERDLEALAAHGAPTTWGGCFSWSLRSPRTCSPTGPSGDAWRFTTTPSRHTSHCSSRCSCSSACRRGGQVFGARERSRPKVYICDPGMLAHLLGADVKRMEEDDQVTGRACETLVAVELLKHASWASSMTRLYHYQREREDVDLVIENRAGEIAAVEAKARASLRSDDWEWLARLRDARGERFRSGIVIYAGEQTIPLGDRLWAVPYAGLWA